MHFPERLTNHFKHSNRRVTRMPRENLVLIKHVFVKIKSLRKSCLVDLEEKSC